MPNLYASLGTVKAEIGKAATTDDTVLLRLTERVSREIDKAAGRHFYAEIATRYFDGNGRRKLPISDLLSVTSLKADSNSDDTYDLTLAVNTDYWLYPDNLTQYTPYYRVDLNPLSNQLGGWPRGRRKVQIVGTWGYSQETETSGTLGAAITDVAATSVTMTASHGLTGGETIYVGTEQIHVSAVATNTLTVIRGINGTTAATASNGAAVTRRRFDRAAEEACVVRVADLWRGVQTGYGASIANAEMGGFVSNTAFAIFRGLIRDVQRPVVA
jgi:hypothetical protein